MRIGLLGGTFDPPHRGHLHLARTAQRKLGLDWILFVPCSRQPLKESAPEASGLDRFAMVALAIQRNPAWSVSPVELERAGVSYTDGSLLALGKRIDADRWFLLMGADSLASISKWRDYVRVLGLATPVVLARQKSTPVPIPPEAAGAEVIILESRVVPVSSTRIREILAEGGSASSLIPTAVSGYIEAQGLYRGKESR